MKKEYYLPIVVFALTAVFLLISFLVFMTGAKSAKLIKSKIKIGAILLTLNSLLWGCNSSNTFDGDTDCYVVAPPIYEKKFIPDNFGFGFNFPAMNRNNLKLPMSNINIDDSVTNSGIGIYLARAFALSTTDRHMIDFQVGFSYFGKEVNDYPVTRRDYLQKVLETNDQISPNILKYSSKANYSQFDSKILYQVCLNGKDDLLFIIPNDFRLFIFSGFSLSYHFSNDLNEEFSLLDETISYKKDLQIIKSIKNNRIAELNNISLANNIEYGWVLGAKFCFRKLHEDFQLGVQYHYVFNLNNMYDHFNINHSFWGFDVRIFFQLRENK